MSVFPDMDRLEKENARLISALEKCEGALKTMIDCFPIHGESLGYEREAVEIARSALAAAEEARGT